MDFEKKALEYHQKKPRGKIEIALTKPLDTQEDLSLAYSPGVAGPCREIDKDQDMSFQYTNRGNLVGVISNGSAVLGLGNLGPWASKPVMEGKAMLFKKFADIDVFDLELNTANADDFIAAVKALEPTFGAINLEDIKAPECFYIEEKLKDLVSIPVFHDDQHGTAIIASAAFINAVEITGRKIEDVKVVFSGAGAAALACARLFIELGVKKENLILCDRTGVVYKGRENVNEYKSRFASDTKHKTMAEAINGADAFVGVSGPDLLTSEMLKSMAESPIVFALANPNPEISPDLAKEVRPDCIVATGRSDYPNQVNNVLGFPYIFRGALDVRAKTVTKEMKLAAVYAIAELAREDVTEDVMSVYKGSERYVFGRDYLIPKPVDQRVLLKVAPAVAKAAMDSGVARRQIDIEDYTDYIERLLGPTRRMIRKLRNEIDSVKKKTGRFPTVVLPQGYKSRVLQAAKEVADDGEIKIILLGNKKQILEKAASLKMDDLGKMIKIIDPIEDDRRASYSKELFSMRERKGVSSSLAWQQMGDSYYFGTMMVKRGDADAMIGGFNRPYARSVKPILEIIGTRGDKTLAGVYMIVNNDKKYFFADCTINIDPTAEQLVEIAIATSETAKRYTNDPIRIAMLSFASFGASDNPRSKKIKKAVEMLKKRCPEIEVDGEMQVDMALDEELREREAPFSTLKGNANVLIFPNIDASNISYKLLATLSDSVSTGPILVGIDKPAHIVQRGAKVREIVNMIYVAAHQSVTAT